MLDGLMEIGIGVVIAILTIYVIKRILGVAFVVLFFLFKVGVYSLPITLTIFFGMMNPWLLIPCCLLSIGYYFLVYKITKKFKARKRAADYY